MAFVRAKGKYHQLVENYRDEEGKHRQRVLCHLGAYSTVEAAYQFWHRQARCKPTWNGWTKTQLIRGRAPVSEFNGICRIDGVQFTGDDVKAYQGRAADKARKLSQYRDPATVKAEQDAKQAKRQKARKKREAKDTAWDDPRSDREWRNAVATLGLSESNILTAQQMKSAYRAKAKQHHPDYGGDAAQFRAIKDAYLYVSTWAPQTFNLNDYLGQQ